MTPERPLDGGGSSGGHPDGGPDGDAAVVQDGAAAACNALELAGAPLLPQVAVAGAMLSPTGGPIAEGTYWLTERQVYGAGADDSLLKRVILVNASSIAEVEGTAASESAPIDVTRRSRSYKLFASIGLSMRETCPGAPMVTNAHFTADGVKLTLYFPDLGVADVYTLQ